MLPRHHHRIIVNIRFGPKTRGSVAAALIVAALKAAPAAVAIMHALAAHIHWLQ